MQQRDDRASRSGRPPHEQRLAQGRPRLLLSPVAARAGLRLIADRASGDRPDRDCRSAWHCRRLGAADRRASQIPQEQQASRDCRKSLHRSSDACVRRGGTRLGNALASIQLIHGVELIATATKHRRVVGRWLCLLCAIHRQRHKAVVDVFPPRIPHPASRPLIVARKQRPPQVPPLGDPPQSGRESGYREPCSREPAKSE